LQPKKLVFLSIKIVSIPSKLTSRFLTDLEVNSGDPIGMGMGAGCSEYKCFTIKC
jgi:hypothetical protein